MIGRSWKGMLSVHPQPTLLAFTETNPRNGPSQKETIVFQIPTIHFQVRTVSFREGRVQSNPRNPQKSQIQLFHFTRDATKWQVWSLDCWRKLWPRSLHSFPVPWAISQIGCLENPVSRILLQMTTGKKKNIYIYIVLQKMHTKRLWTLESGWSQVQSWTGYNHLTLACGRTSQTISNKGCTSRTCLKGLMSGRMAKQVSSKRFTCRNCTKTN